MKVALIVYLLFNIETEIGTPNNPNIMQQETYIEHMLTDDKLTMRECERLLKEYSETVVRELEERIQFPLISWSAECERVYP